MVAKVLLHHRDLQVSMHQGCVLQSYQGGCGGVLCCPRYPSRRVEVGGAMDGGTTDGEVCSDCDDGGSNGGDGMDRCIPNSKASPNTNLNSNDMGSPKRSKGSPSRSTNYRQVLPLRPTSRTSR